MRTGAWHASDFRLPPDLFLQHIDHLLGQIKLACFSGRQYDVPNRPDLKVEIWFASQGADHCGFMKILSMRLTSNPDRCPATRMLISFCNEVAYAERASFLFQAHIDRYKRLFDALYVDWKLVCAETGKDDWCACGFFSRCFRIRDLVDLIIRAQDIRRAHASIEQATHCIRQYHWSFPVCTQRRYQHEYAFYVHLVAHRALQYAFSMPRVFDNCSPLSNHHSIWFTSPDHHHTSHGSLHAAALVLMDERQQSYILQHLGASKQASGKGQFTSSIQKTNEIVHTLDRDLSPTMLTSCVARGVPALCAEVLRTANLLNQHIYSYEPTSLRRIAGHHALGRAMWIILHELARFHTSLASVNATLYAHNTSVTAPAYETMLWDRNFNDRMFALAQTLELHDESAHRAHHTNFAEVKRSPTMLDGSTEFALGKKLQHLLVPPSQKRSVWRTIQRVAWPAVVFDCKLFAHSQSLSWALRKLLDTLGDHEELCDLVFLMCEGLSVALTKERFPSGVPFPPTSRGRFLIINGPAPGTPRAPHTPANPLRTPQPTPLLQADAPRPVMICLGSIAEVEQDAQFSSTTDSISLRRVLAIMRCWRSRARTRMRTCVTAFAFEATRDAQLASVRLNALCWYCPFRRAVCGRMHLDLLRRNDLSLTSRISVAAKVRLQKITTERARVPFPVDFRESPALVAAARAHAPLYLPSLAEVWPELVADLFNFDLPVMDTVRKFATQHLSVKMLEDEGGFMRFSGHRANLRRRAPDKVSSDTSAAMVAAGGVEGDEGAEIEAPASKRARTNAGAPANFQCSHCSGTVLERDRRQHINARKCPALAAHAPVAVVKKRKFARRGKKRATGRTGGVQAELVGALQARRLHDAGAVGSQ